MPHEHIMVLPLKTPEIIIIIVLNKLLKKLSVMPHCDRSESCKLSVYCYSS